MEIDLKWGFSLLNGLKITDEVSGKFPAEPELVLGENRFSITRERKEIGENAEEISCHFKADKADIKEGRLFISATLSGYRDDWFIFMPSACYDGNQFKMIDVTDRAASYFQDFVPRDTMMPEIVTKELPSLHNGFNRQITDASSPLIGIFIPETREAFFLALEQDTLLGNNGLEMKLDPEKKSLEILLSLPSCRRKSFVMCRNLDTAPSLVTGQNVDFSFQMRRMPAKDIAEFYKDFAIIRNYFPEQGPYKHYRSFSHAEDILLKMFEEVRFLKDYGFYTKARGQKRLELGWVSGQEYSALFFNGNENVKKQVMTNLEFIFQRCLLENGFFLQIAEVKEDEKLHIRALNYPMKEPQGTTLMRFECEMLFFLTKLLSLLESCHASYPTEWKNALYKLAEALEKLFLTYGQFGNILEVATGKLLLGGSGSGMAGPGAFAVAAEFFREPRFMQLARNSAKDYCKSLHRHGFTFGGPGDAMNTPDSESSFSLLESLVTLAELDEENRETWIREAEFCADYCSSWVPAVAYKFPENSTFHKLGIDCRGSVQANLQNQHGAPAACISSSSAYFRLYRMTGKLRYLELLKEIAHNCVQYISTENTPIITNSKGNPYLPTGDICEKVYFQDYTRSRGEIYCASGGWPEIAVLLTITENPGIYCIPEKGFCFTMDHVDAGLEGDTLTVSNPFDYAITVNILTEKEEERKTPLGFWPFLNYKKLSLAPKEKKSILLTAL